MKTLVAGANPPVVRDADADLLFQRRQAKRRVSGNTCDLKLGNDSNDAGEQDSVGKSERSGKPESVGKRERADESGSSGNYPPLNKGGGGDSLFADPTSANPGTTHASQKIGRR